MKKQDKIKNLKTSIKEKRLQLEKLNLHINKSSVCSDLYNKVILEKAILTKELQDLENDNVLTKVQKIMPRRKKQICDYFKK